MSPHDFLRLHVALELGRALARARRPGLKLLQSPIGLDYAELLI